MASTLLSSPLQGFTDFRFRNAFNHYFGGIDTFYSPYIRLNGKLKMVKTQKDQKVEKKNVSEVVLGTVNQTMHDQQTEFLLLQKKHMNSMVFV